MDDIRQLCECSLLFALIGALMELFAMCYLTLGESYLVVGSGPSRRFQLPELRLQRETHMLKSLECWRDGVLQKREPDKCEWIMCKAEGAQARAGQLYVPRIFLSRPVSVTREAPFHWI